MIKRLFLLLILFITHDALCQDKIITGRIFYNNGEPLIGVSVCQSYSNNCDYTDYKGAFHILLEPKIDSSLMLSYVGYHPLEIHNLDTISQQLSIILYEDTSYSDVDIPHTRKIHKFGFITFFQVDFIQNDFVGFKSLLNEYNIDLMNRSSGIYSFELAGTYRKYYAGFNWGFSFDGEYDHDSLDIEFNTTQYGLHLGYNLINSKRFLLTPKVAVKWNRYRLINNDKDRRIPIEQYVTDRDIDIRFNQLTGFVGLNLSYKFYNHNIMPTDYWTFGIYGGYCFKLNDKPWIYSKRNRLTTDSKINVENYNVGIHFSFNFD